MDLFPVLGTVTHMDRWGELEIKQHLGKVSVQNFKYVSWWSLKFTGMMIARHCPSNFGVNTKHFGGLGVDENPDSRPKVGQNIIKSKLNKLEFALDNFVSPQY